MLLVLLCASLGCLTTQTGYADLVADVIDADGDGYYDETVWKGDEHLDMVDLASGDCDDGNREIHPGADEVCDGFDNDCDGDIDEDLDDLVGWYLDDDRDGFGDPDRPIEVCPFPENAVLDDSDCDDGEAAINPDAAEWCNDLDDDCDGSVDEGELSDWYEDEDGDGYGTGAALQHCDPGDGYANADGDCDETDPDVNPGEVEVCNDGIDNDCDEATDCRFSGTVPQDELNAIYGVDVGENFGSRIAAGDVDGGADNDVLVNGANATRDGTVNGAVTLFKDGVSTPHALFLGTEEIGAFGYAVDLFDVSGDGRDDVIVGGDLNGGDVYVFERPWTSENQAADASTHWSADGAGGRFGHAVEGMLDVDGAGTSGVATGAITEDETGAVHILPWAQGSYDPDTLGDVIAGHHTDGLFGAIVMTADIDGDGIDELLASAPNAGPAATDGGAVYAFRRPWPSTVEDADAVIEGATQYGQLEHIAAADLDQDGIDELFVGGPGTGWDPPGTLWAFAELDDGVTSTDDADLTILGSSDYSGFGYWSAVADLDNSGISDLAVSASVEGSVYLFYAPATSGSYSSDDADAELQLTSSQKQPLLTTPAWAAGGDSLLIGCPKCVGPDGSTGGLYWIEARGH